MGKRRKGRVFKESTGWGTSWGKRMVVRKRRRGRVFKESADGVGCSKKAQGGVGCSKKAQTG